MPELSDTLYSETDAANSQPAPNGMPEGMPPSGVNDAWRAGMGALKRFWNRINATQRAGGTANALTLTYAVGPASYAAGETFRFIAGAANTGAATLAINGLPAQSITKPGPIGPTPLTGGEIQPGQVVSLTYDGAQFVMTSVPGKDLPSAKAWVYFTVSGGVVTVQAGFNVASVARNSSGNFTVNFANPMSDANYAVAGTADGSANNLYSVIGQTRTTIAYNFVTTFQNGSAAVDPSGSSIVIFGI